MPNWLSALASAAVNPDDELAIYSRYSGIPRERWGRVGGNAVYVDEAGQLHRAVAPVSEATGVGDAILRTGQWVGSGIGPAVPQVAGALAALPFAGPFAQAGGALVGGGAGDFVRQQLVNAMLGRSPTNVDVGNVAGHAALAGGSSLLGSALARGIERVRGENIGVTGMQDRAAMTNPRNLAQWRQEAQNAQDLGIILRPDQITNLPSMRQTARQLMREPGSTNAMGLFQREQQGARIPAALASEIPAVTPGPGGGAQAFAEGADDVLRQARQARTAAASPHYQAAVGDVIPPGSVTANYRPAAASFDEGSTIAARINGFADRIEGAQNATQLDGIYREIRDAAAVANREGNTTLGHHLGNLRDALNAQLTGAPGVPAISPNVAAGRQVYRQMSPAIDEMQRGIPGMAARLVNNPDIMSQRSGVSSILSRGNADEIRAARTAFENAGRLDAWNAGVREFLGGAADMAQRVRIEGNMPGNVAGRFLQEAAPTPLAGQATAEMLGGAGSQEAARFGRLAQALRAASNTVQEGSPTITDLFGRNRLAGPLARALEGATRLASPANLGNAIREGGIARNAPSLAEAYTGLNPMRVIENAGVLSPAQFRAAQAAGQSVPISADLWLRAFQRGQLPNQYPAYGGGQ